MLSIEWTSSATSPTAPTARPTPVIAAAAARGLRSVDGLELLVRQGARSFALFFGVPAPLDVMRRAAWGVGVNTIWLIAACLVAGAVVGLAWAPLVPRVRPTIGRGPRSAALDPPVRLAAVPGGSLGRALHRGRAAARRRPEAGAWPAPLRRARRGDGGRPALPDHPEPRRASRGSGRLRRLRGARARPLARAPARPR